MSECLDFHSYFQIWASQHILNSRNARRKVFLLVAAELHDYKVIILGPEESKKPKALKERVHLTVWVRMGFQLFPDPVLSIDLIIS